MTEVTVVFPKSGGLDVEDRETCFEKAGLAWRVQSFNKDIRSVQITFDSGVNFFDNTQNPNQSPERDLTYTGAAGNEYAEVQIYGRAPAGAGEETYKRYKYTVTGFKPKEQKEEVDPQITVVKDIGGGN